MLVSAPFFALALGLVSRTALAASPSSQYELDPNSVPGPTRDQWCLAQRNTCSQLCKNQIDSNECDSSTLKWECECNGGNTPNIAEYAQTLASLQCDEWKVRCVNAAPNDLDGQEKCLAVKCGNKNASTNASPSSSSSGTPTSTSSSNSSSSSSSSSPTSTSEPPPESGAFRMAVSSSQVYGIGALVGVIGMAFGLGL